MPYLMLIAILIVIRMLFLPLRAWLNAERPRLTLDWGSPGTFSASVALVFKLDSIFGTPSDWSYNSLFVPALIPFVVVVFLYAAPENRPSYARKVVADTTNRLSGPSVTLVGTLIMVQLMTLGGDKAQTMIIGRTFDAVMGKSWPFFAPVLGALAPSSEARPPY